MKSDLLHYRYRRSTRISKMMITVNPNWRSHEKISGTNHCSGVPDPTGPDSVRGTWQECGTSSDDKSDALTDQGHDTVERNVRDCLPDNVCDRERNWGWNPIWQIYGSLSHGN